MMAEASRPMVDALQADPADRIRVAFMLTPVDFGGAERVCLTFLENIDRDRFDVIPILLTRPWEPENYFVREVEKEGYRPILIPVANTETGDHFRVLRCARLTARALRAGRCELLHTNGYFADIVGIPIAKALGIPTVSTSHGYIASSWNVRLYNALDRAVLRLGNRVLAVSDGIRSQLIDAGLDARKIDVVVNAVEQGRRTDTPSRAATRAGLGYQDSDFVCGYVGRLSAEKGLRDLLHAAHQLLARAVPLKVLIVGDGPQREELEALARKLSIAEATRFAGFQRDISVWLSSMDLFALPSLTEGTPMALLEAMAQGVPVVASAVGGVPNVIASETSGVLIPPSDPDALARAIFALFSSTETRKRYAKEASKVIKSEFGIAAWIEKIEAVYEALAR